MCSDTILHVTTVNQEEIVEIVYFHLALDGGFPKEIYLSLSYVSIMMTGGGR